ncbi:hypothetical protein CHGG_02223 [Chaetomium globosum CBS 148.51]|uniref:DUF1479 domain protein n=1 Tax=Chaetomium globosum (strain ATCC 6205 / CBS 148.51 / DSM 1962 / NBRC 6347 / NRRL 1970) TaxID=306901 RepID=Q2HC31_CHAGB|nr:uncharacterized protein CHGG_02223 [Chaetomium globosum CBS 148.51]EAQ90288.1 hypothetical protein CHGG_02223 [Chaetomium globosum CBS 148.51]
MTGSTSGAAVTVSTRASSAAAAAAAAAAIDVVMGGTSTTGAAGTTGIKQTPTSHLNHHHLLYQPPQPPPPPPPQQQQQQPHHLHHHPHHTATAAAATAAAAAVTTIVSANLLATVGSNHSANSLNDRGLEPRARCSQCGRRRTACHHLPYQQGLQQPTSSSSGSPASANAIPGPGPANGSLSAAPSPLQPRPRRISKLRHRAAAALTGSAAQQPNAAAINSVTFSPHPTTSSTPPALSSASDPADTTGSSSAAMEPPVLSFYGKEPVPLPSRFGQIKRSLVAGREKEIEASWARLIKALRDDVEDIASRGSSLTPSIDFGDIHNPDARAAFSRDLKRYGLGLVRGVVPRDDAQVAIDETVKYLEKQTDFKQPSPQDPTCFDFFWTPAQVRTRAHPRVLEAQRFAMSLWDNNVDDRMALRFPIAYGDRLRIHGADIGNVGPDAAAANKAKEADEMVEDIELDEELEAQKAAADLLGDFTSSTIIAQVDNGSLERWEPDGYGRDGTYDAVFRGEWEKYDPWDPTHRVTATSDLYNGYGACSIFRMYQGVVALSTIEPGLIRLLPSPKLATAYFLLRPFFTPKTKAPERRDGPEWDAFLDPSNWELEKEQSTIIHGAVPGHAQRLTETWHPHLHLRRTLQTIPTLQTGDYIVWHPDLAYHMTSNPNVMASRAPTPPPMAETEEPSGKPVSILVYVPAAPLTQTNALYLARQRKTFQRGHPGPDFDSTGSGLGSEATHIGRPTDNDIAEVGGPAGLQAMGLAPFDVAPTPPATASADQSPAPGAALNGEGRSGEAEDGSAGGSGSMTRAEAEVARLANIILFPDRYDFYMAKRNSNGSKRSKVKVERLLNPVDPPTPPREVKGKGRS